MRVRVVKVGGSLFGNTRMPQDLRQWLARGPAVATLLVAGGGALADVVRQLDARFPLHTALCHRFGVETMRMHAEILLDLLPDADWIPSVVSWRARLARAGEAAFGVLDPSYFVGQEQALLAGTPLPCGWHVTSDSIAARMAETIGAQELVLLKSALPPGGPAISYERAAAERFVDAHFPAAAQGLGHVRAVNLADGAFPEIVLTGT